ncbi:hypothetical protein GQX74_006172 [Glossina fuscipes]|nr:hypothetical protein GQX74_006172 [Glossina fuscipes]
MVPLFDHLTYGIRLISNIQECEYHSDEMQEAFYVKILLSRCLFPSTDLMYSISVNFRMLRIAYGFVSTFAYLNFFRFDIFTTRIGLSQSQRETAFPILAVRILVQSLKDIVLSQVSIKSH